jgi:hypothetical protein
MKKPGDRYAMTRLTAMGFGRRYLTRAFSLANLTRLRCYLFGCCSHAYYGYCVDCGSPHSTIPTTAKPGQSRPRSTGSADTHARRTRCANATNADAGSYRSSSAIAVQRNAKAFGCRFEVGMSFEETITEAVVKAIDAKIGQLADLSQPLVVSQLQAAKLLSCTPRQVANLQRLGVLKPVHWPGGKKRSRPYYAMSDLRNAIERAKGGEV